MSDDIVFEFQGNKVRTDIGDDGEPLFCASDVARILGYTNPKKAVRDHCDEVTIRSLIDSMGRKQTANFIGEPDLYGLILSSKLPDAKRFKKWVTKVVLPSIRKTGAYAVVGSLTRLEIARMLVESEERKLELEEKQRKNEPFVLVGRSFMDTGAAVKIEEFVKSAVIDGRVIGRNNMFKVLRKNGILQKNNLPYQNQINAGRFRVIQGERPDGKGGMKPCFTTYVTKKGEGFCVNLLRNDPEFFKLTNEFKGKKKGSF